MNKMNAEKANVVIVGGGVFGNSIAYHYSKNNPGKKVIVLERNELCNAATSRAAAMITKIRAKKEFIPLAKQTYTAIDEMEKLLGESLDIKKVGILHIAASESKVNELDELVKTAEEFNERCEYISAEKAEQITPWLNASSALKIAFMPDEAYCDPYLLGTFYARSAKILGAHIRQGIEVTDILMDGNTATGVVTNDGIIEADVVIIASGAWAPVLAKKADINLALAPVRSQYWITERNEIFPATSPMVVLPDVNAYLRPESGALLFGIRERKSIAVSPKDVPNDISSFKFSDDKGMNDLSEVIDKLAKFFPKIYDIGLKYYIAGFSAYTPDNYLSMGSTTQKNNLLFATGCVGAGIAVCGGVGLAFAEMAAGKTNPYDFSAFNIHRFGEIDPFGEEWLQRCAVARSVKNSG
ncbi:MAG TPA: FAD-binding oxidoreductase [Chitinophagaceae bacterium]|nr:FAD-binding oxidoreductase [Chitinophagaceae bacterium]